MASNQESINNVLMIIETILRDEYSGADNPALKFYQTPTKCHREKALKDYCHSYGSDAHFPGKSNFTHYRDTAGLRLRVRKLADDNSTLSVYSKALNDSGLLFSNITSRLNRLKNEPLINCLRFWIEDLNACNRDETISFLRMFADDLPPESFQYDVKFGDHNRLKEQACTYLSENLYCTNTFQEVKCHDAKFAFDTVGCRDIQSGATPNACELIIIEAKVTLKDYLAKHDNLLSYCNYCDRLFLITSCEDVVNLACDDPELDAIGLLRSKDGKVELVREAKLLRSPVDSENLPTYLTFRNIIRRQILKQLESKIFLRCFRDKIYSPTRIAEIFKEDAATSLSSVYEV